MATSEHADQMAAQVATEGKRADYEKNALKAIERSWRLDDPVCQALALQDAQAWATLRLAENIERLADLTEGA